MKAREKVARERERKKKKLNQGTKGARAKRQEEKKTKITTSFFVVALRRLMVERRDSLFYQSTTARPLIPTALVLTATCRLFLCPRGKKRRGGFSAAGRRSAFLSHEMKQQASLETSPPLATSTASSSPSPSSLAAARRQETLRKLPAFLRPPRDAVRYAAIFLDVDSREELLCR